MWKNVLIVVLLGVLAAVLFFGNDMSRFFGRIGMREVVIILLVAGTLIAARVIWQGARRL